MRRTKIQLETHRRDVVRLLVHGVAEPDVVQRMMELHGLTARQARCDLKAVWDNFREGDRSLLRGHRLSRDLAAFAARKEEDVRRAMAEKDLQAALAAEQERCRVLKIYPDIRTTKGRPVSKQEKEEDDRNRDAAIARMYTNAPRNEDGSIRISSYSYTPQPVDEPIYRRRVEQPLGRRLNRVRRERVQWLRRAVIHGADWDDLEQLDQMHFKVSQRQSRADALVVMETFEDDGGSLRMGTHRYQSIEFALARRKAMKNLVRLAEPPDEKLAEAIQQDCYRLQNVTRRVEKVGKPTEEDFDRGLEVAFAELDARRGFRHKVPTRLEDVEKPGVALQQNGAAGSSSLTRRVKI